MSESNDELSKPRAEEPRATEPRAESEKLRLERLQQKGARELARLQAERELALEREKTKQVIYRFVVGTALVASIGSIGFALTRAPKSDEPKETAVVQATVAPAESPVAAVLPAAEPDPKPVKKPRKPSHAAQPKPPVVQAELATAQPGPVAAQADSAAVSAPTKPCAEDAKPEASRTTKSELRPYPIALVEAERLCRSATKKVPSFPTEDGTGESWIEGSVASEAGKQVKYWCTCRIK